MSAINPLKYLGGLVLEIGAVVAALAFIPALGGGFPEFGSQPRTSSYPGASQPQSQDAWLGTNQVFFDAESSRVLDSADANRAAANAAWQNDFAPPPPVAQQRYVENMLDHNSQRALDTAARVWNRGDQLLPPELRVRREAVEPLPPAPVTDTPVYVPRMSQPEAAGSPYVAPQNTAPQPRSYYAPRVNFNDQPTRRQFDDRY